MNRLSNYLNLQFDPFESGSANCEIFIAASRQTLLDRLFESLHYGSGIVALTGSLGSGKSTIGRQIIEGLGEEAVVISIPATLFMNQDHFLDALFQQLIHKLPAESFNPSSPAEAVEHLSGLAERLDMDGRSLVLVVDDAHELSGDVLELIAELRGESANSNIRVLMLGEHQLLKLIDSSLSALAKQGLHDYDIEGFSAEETAEYIHFKLSGAGHIQGLPLDGAAIGSIHNASNGAPGTINALAAEAIMSGLEEVAIDDETEAVPHPARLWGVAAAILCALLLVAIVWTGTDTQEYQQASADKPVDVRSIPIPLTQSSSVDPELSIGSDVGSDVAAADPVAQKQTAEISEEDIDEANNPPPSLVTASVDQPVTVEATNVESSAESRQEIEPSSIVSTAQSSQVSISPFEQQLLNFPADSYTVQLLGSRSEENVQEFVSGKVGIGYFETRYKNLPWFVVVQGNYQNRTAALTAIQSLPEADKQLQPWVRTLSDIQRDIKAANSLSALN